MKISPDSRYSVGVIPVNFLNALLKFAVLLKPHSEAMFIIFSPESAIRRDDQKSIPEGLLPGHRLAGERDGPHRFGLWKPYREIHARRRGSKDRGKLPSICVRQGSSPQKNRDGENRAPAFPRRSMQESEAALSYRRICSSWRGWKRRGGANTPDRECAETKAKCGIPPSSRPAFWYRRAGMSLVPS